MINLCQRRHNKKSIPVPITERRRGKKKYWYRRCQRYRLFINPPFFINLPRTQRLHQPAQNIFINLPRTQHFSEEEKGQALLYPTSPGLRMPLIIRSASVRQRIFHCYHQMRILTVLMNNEDAHINCVDEDHGGLNSDSDEGDYKFK